MKLIYIANIRLPSEKANSYQTMQMCESFSKVFDSVELWTGKARNTKELKNVEDIFAYYGLNKTFRIRCFFQYDSYILGHTNEWLWANLRGVVFSINTCIHLIKYRESNDLIVYTRVWNVLFIFNLLKKLKILNVPIFYEAHRFSKRLVNQQKKTNGLVVINQYLANLYKKNNIKSIFVAHDGVNIDLYEKIGDYQFDSNKTEINILYTGSLFAWKGVETLVDAMEFLPEKYRLVCIGGSGKYLQDFKEYVGDKKECDRIKIIGHMPKIELLKFVEKADVLVLPNSAKDKMSLYTSPIKLFEYMASKRPIVASDLPSIKEVLSDNNAYFFTPDNARKLAIKIEEATRKDCGSKVENAYKSVEHYTWDNRAKNIAKFLTNNA